MCIKVVVGGQEVLYVKYLYYLVSLQPKNKIKIDLMLNRYVYMHLCMQISPYVLFVPRTFMVVFRHIIIYKECNTWPYISQETYCSRRLYIMNWFCLHRYCLLEFFLIAIRTVNPILCSYAEFWIVSIFTIKSVLKCTCFLPVCCFHHFDAIWMQR